MKPSSTCRGHLGDDAVEIRALVVEWLLVYVAYASLACAQLPGLDRAQYVEGRRGWQGGRGGKHILRGGPGEN